MPELISIVSVEAPSEVEPEKPYTSVVTIKNNQSFSLAFRYKWTITRGIETTSAPFVLPTLIKAGETKEIPLETIAKTAGLEKHQFTLYMLIRKQGRTWEWEVTVTGVPPPPEIAAKIIETAFSQA